ncbi:right-handed parallel beta-helix repeat-containing protein, partial [Candidatus Cloacimonadota bacterium]
DGHAFLENQTDHSGILVSLLRLDSFTFYTTTTDETGAYSIVIPFGNYNISFSNVGYNTQIAYSNTPLFSDTTLSDVTLLVRITTLHVPDMYATIQEAINAAMNGDTVLVAPGEYAENVTMSLTNITLASHFLTTGNRDFIEQTIIRGNNDRVITYGGWGGVISGFSIIEGDATAGVREPGCGAAILVGGEANLSIDHCLFYSNYAELNGIIYISFYSSVDIEHCTFANNSQDNSSVIYCGELAWVVIKNTIIWGEQGIPLEKHQYSDLYVEYSLIQDGYTGVGNIDVDPLFANPISGDFHLSWENFPSDDETKSPCIDAGDPLMTDDPDETPPDIGAFFFDQNPPAFEIINLLNNATDPDNDMLLVSCILAPEFSITEPAGLSAQIQGGITSTWSLTSTVVTATSNHSFQSSFDLVNDPQAPFPEGDWTFVATYDDGSQIHTDDDPLRIESSIDLPSIFTQTPTNPVTTTIEICSFLNNAMPPGFGGVGLNNDGELITTTMVVTDSWGDDGTQITSTFSFADRPRDIGDWLFYVIFDWDDFEYALADPIPFDHILPTKPENVIISITDDQVNLSWDAVTGCSYKIYSSTDPNLPLWMWDLQTQVLTQTSWSGQLTNEKRFYIVRAESN